MTDWSLAVNIFFTGIIGVMVVMFLLQVCIQAISAVIRIIEKSNINSETKS